MVGSSSGRSPPASRSVATRLLPRNRGRNPHPRVASILVTDVCSVGFVYTRSRRAGCQRGPGTEDVLHVSCYSAFFGQRSVGRPRVSKKPKRVLTRGDFLKTAGVAGASLLGAAGCSSLADTMPRLPDEYLPGGGAGPNVILVIIDSLRRDHVGAYGNPWIQTPILDAIAKESLLFTHAQPEAMPTLPARRAIYTGMRTWPTSPPHFGWTSIPSSTAHAGRDPRR